MHDSEENHGPTVVAATPAGINRTTAGTAPAWPPVALGAAMTLCARGYRFGESNHAVYLLDALRRNEPGLLANDWWASATLQYHFTFNALTALLMRMGVLEPAFLAGYLGLAVLLHVAWRKLVLLLVVQASYLPPSSNAGRMPAPQWLGDGVYILSVLLYYLLAAGTGLGMYQFLQDSSFLPSNVANVAMLWGLYFLIAGRDGRAGLCLGLAGLFHLNHALVGIGLWGAMALLRLRVGGIRPIFYSRNWWLGTASAVLLSLPSILPALRTVLTRQRGMPLAEFVDLYVRLRHPHHYDPSSWGWLLWLSFLAPIPFAVVAWRAARREHPSPELRRAADIFLIFCGLLLVALLGAGVWYVSESLVQMSLYRFSIYPKLLSCTGLAWLLWERGPRARTWTWRITLAAWAVLAVCFVLVYYSQRPLPIPPALKENVTTLWLFTALAAVALAIVLGLPPPRRYRLIATVLAGLVFVALSFGRREIGLTHPGLRGDDPAYLAAARWARDHTPVGAVFLVPPDEQSFRLHARRAVVVNFKNVPQLSGELPGWRDRLEAVTGMDDLRALPRPFHRTLDALRARYAARPAEDLSAIARRYGARYVLAVRPLDPAAVGQEVYADRHGGYFLYDLGPGQRAPDARE